MQVIKSPRELILVITYTISKSLRKLLYFFGEFGIYTDLVRVPRVIGISILDLFLEEDPQAFGLHRSHH